MRGFERESAIRFYERNNERLLGTAIRITGGLREKNRTYNLGALIFSLSRAFAAAVSPTPRSLAMTIDDAQNSKLRSPIVRSVHHFLVYIIDYLSNFSVDKIEQFFRIETFHPLLTVIFRSRL